MKSLNCQRFRSEIRHERGYCDEAECINKKLCHQMRPSRSCIMNPMHLAIIRRYWCGVGKGPSWVSETCFRCTMSVREGSERSGTNEERGILENSAVREDHDWRFFSVGPRHFSNLSTSLPTAGFKHLRQVQLIRAAQAQQLIYVH